MTPIPNPQVVYAKHPIDYPNPGECQHTTPIPVRLRPRLIPLPSGEHLVYEPDAESIDINTVPLNGGVLLKTLYVSVDPYTRSQMRDPSVPSFSPPFTIGQPCVIYHPTVACGRESTDIAL